jgi:hypothetical protein
MTATATIIIIIVIIMLLETAIETECSYTVSALQISYGRKLFIRVRLDEVVYTHWLLPGRVFSSFIFRIKLSLVALVKSLFF